MPCCTAPKLNWNSLQTGLPQGSLSQLAPARPSIIQFAELHLAKGQHRDYCAQLPSKRLSVGLAILVRLKARRNVVRSAPLSQATPARPQSCIMQKTSFFNKPRDGKGPGAIPHRFPWSSWKVVMGNTGKLFVILLNFSKKHFTTEYLQYCPWIPRLPPNRSLVVLGCSLGAPGS